MNVAFYAKALVLLLSAMSASCSDLEDRRQHARVVIERARAAVQESLDAPHYRSQLPVHMAGALRNMHPPFSCLQPRDEIESVVCAHPEIGTLAHWISALDVESQVLSSDPSGAMRLVASLSKAQRKCGPVRECLLDAYVRHTLLMASYVEGMVDRH